MNFFKLISECSWLKFIDFIILNVSGGRFIVTHGTGDLYIRNIRPEDGLKRFACATSNSLTGERKLSESISLTIKGDID